MKKILIMSPTTVTGGGTQFCIGISKFLKSKKCRVYYVGPKDSEEFLKLTDICDVVLDLNLKKFRPLVFFKIFLLIIQKNIDIVHSNGKVPGVYAYFYSLLFNKLRVIHTFHGIHYAQKSLVYRTLTFLIEKIFLGSNVIRHFVSFSEKCLFEQFFGVARNSVVIENTNFREKELGCIDFTPTRDFYLYVGRITQVKNIDFIVKNIIQLNNEGVLKKTVKLNVVGFIDDTTLISKNDFIYQESIRELVSKQDTNSAVDLLPITSDPLAFIASCKAIILASDTEGLPLAFLEAMSAGKPLIGASVPGIVDLIDNEVNGFLFACNDGDDFKSKLYRFEQDQKLLVDMGRASLARYRANYANCIFYDKLGHLYFDEN
jgi:glycosyltransferase involved in cell wall biosynthesis